MGEYGKMKKLKGKRVAIVDVPPPTLFPQKKNKQKIEKGLKSQNGFHQERCGKRGGLGQGCCFLVFFWFVFFRSSDVRFCGCGGAVIYVSCDDETEKG